MEKYALEASPHRLATMVFLALQALSVTVCAQPSCVPTIEDDLSPVALPYSQIALNLGYSNDVVLSCDPGGAAGAGGDVIYRYTPPCTSTYTIIVWTDPTRPLDTVLEVRQDDACTGAVVACNNDHTTAIPGLQATDSVITTVLSGGTNYFFLIDGAGGAEGFFFFDLSSAGCTCGGLGESLVEDIAVSLKSNGSAIGTQGFPYENDMESFAGFTSRGDTSLMPSQEQDQRWELGVPSALKLPGDHTRGSGTKCLATDLNGGVREFLGRMTAISQWVAIPPAATVENPSVSFWFATDSTPPGRGNVVISSVQIETMGGQVLAVHPNRNNFSQFPPVAVYGPVPMCSSNDTQSNPPGWWQDHSISEDPTSEAGWAFCTLDLGSFAGQTVRLRWNYWNLGYEPGCPTSGCPAPGLAVDDLKFGWNVVINEVHVGDGTAADPSWIELYNNNPSTIDLAGWTLEVDDGVSTLVTELPLHPLRTYHAVVVIEGTSPFGVDETWTHLWNRLTTDLSTGTGGAVTLKDPSGVAVDFVKWGGNPTAAPSNQLWSGTIGNPGDPADSIARTRLAVDTGQAADFDIVNGRDSVRPTPGYDNDDTVPVEIVSVSLKKASVGYSYIDKLEAVGGMPPYTWAMVGGAWPALAPPGPMGPDPTTGVVTTGSALIGAGQEGLFNVTVEVTDALGATDTQELVLTIGPLPPTDLVHTQNTVSSLSWQWVDQSATETGFALRVGSGPRTGALALSGIGASCPRDASGYGTTFGGVIPDVGGGCHTATETDETALRENAQYCRSVHAAHALPSIVQGVVINEMDLGQNDMVELYNYSTTDTDISDWRIELNIRQSTASCSCGSGVLCEFYQFLPGTILKSGATVRVYDNGNPAEDTVSVKNKGSNWNPATGAIMNCVLKDDTGVELDAVEINADYDCGKVGPFSGFVAMAGNNKLQRIVDLDGDSSSDWRVEPAVGTPGSLNPGQAGIVIFQAESAAVTSGAPLFNLTCAYTSVHTPTAADLSLPSLGDTFIDIAITEPPRATTDNTGIQVEWFLDADTSGSPTGAETPALLAAWMSPAEGGGYLDETSWSNVYTHSHTGLSPGTQYCYRFRYRNGDGDPAGPGDITPFSPWACEVTTANCSIGTLTCGDCDGDGFVTITDSLRMAMIDAGLAVAPTYGTDGFNACNVQGAVPPATTARINILDALYNARHVIGLNVLRCCAP